MAIDPQRSFDAGELLEACRVGTVSGVALGLAYLPIGWGALGLVALVPWLGWLRRAPGGLAAALSGFLLGAWAYGLAFSFVPLAPLAHAPIVYGLGIPALASSLAAVAWLASRSWLGPGAALWIAPAAWALAEGMRSHPALGLPWLHLSHALVDLPGLALAARWVGDLGLSAGVVAWNAMVVGLLRPRMRLAEVAGRVLAPLCLAFGLVLPAAAGTPSSPDEELGGAALRVAAVQPDQSHDADERRARHDESLAGLVRSSQRAVARGADLVVWPETVYEREVPAEGDAFLGVMARSLGVPLLIGARRRVGPETTRNAVILAEPSGRSRVAAEKIHPLPVFERAPRSVVGRWLAELGVWTGRHEPGATLDVVDLALEGRTIRLGILICADLGHPDLVRDLRRRGAELLVHVTDESHLGGWAAGLHARVARLRAIELAVPVVRVANQGPSQWIDSGGRVRAELGAGAPDVGTHGVPLARAASRLPPSSAAVLAGLSVGAACPSLAFAIGSRRSRPRNPKEPLR